MKNNSFPIATHTQNKNSQNSVPMYISYVKLTRVSTDEN
jgi:hypothetical protein